MDIIVESPLYLKNSMEVSLRFNRWFSFPNLFGERFFDVRQEEARTVPGINSA
jgi:hypothetical protein